MRPTSSFAPPNDSEVRGLLAQRSDDRVLRIGAGEPDRPTDVLAVHHRFDDPGVDGRRRSRGSRRRPTQPLQRLPRRGAARPLDALAFCRSKSNRARAMSTTKLVHHRPHIVRHAG
jgi:hypothetical protein